MKTILYVLAGIAIGALLFISGEMEDAPGLCLMGLMIAFVLIMRGIYYTKLIQKGYYIPIILVVFGMIGITLPIILILDNEIEALSFFTFASNSAGVAMITTAILKIRKVRRGK